MSATVRLWVLDSNLFFKLMEGSDPALQPLIHLLAARADEEEAVLAIAAVTAQEYLVRPHQLGDAKWHEARGNLEGFEVLMFDKAAAEEAAKLERARGKYLEAIGQKTRAKETWFRDAAIVGTAIARGAECVWTHDGPLSRMAPHVTGTSIRHV